MTVGDVISSLWFWLVVAGSFAGSLFACRRLASRLWFFIIAPPLYLMLWLLIGAILSVSTPFSATPHLIVTTGVTLAMYVLNCVVLHADGPKGVRLVSGLGKGQPGSRGGDGKVGIPSSPVTYRRMSLDDTP